MVEYPYICADFKPLDLAYSIKIPFRLLLVCLISFQVAVLFCAESNTAEIVALQHDHGDHDGHDHGDHDGHDHGDHEDHGQKDHGHELSCDHPHGDHDYDPKATALHHISDANVYTILDWIRIPLPCIVYSKEAGWDFFMSSKFAPGHHDDGHYAYNGYVIHHGNLKRVVDSGFPMEGKQEVGSFLIKHVTRNGKEAEDAFVCYNNDKYALESRSTLDFGLLGGGLTGFYDFSITKNVMSMILVSLLLFFLFRSIAKAYQRREGQAPSGIQSLIEPVIVYIRDEVAIPFIGEHKYQKYFPLLLTMFFFILGLNLWGQVPFLGGTNVTGNLTVTFIITPVSYTHLTLPTIYSV